MGAEGLGYRFTHWATAIAKAAGRPAAFGLAVAVVLAWIASGPVFGWSEVWQLVINTGTTIVTFLMVFLLQNSQNRDTKAVQAKLDEIVHAIGGARDELEHAEERDEEEIEALRR